MRSRGECQGLAAAANEAWNGKEQDTRVEQRRAREEEASREGSLDRSGFQAEGIVPRHQRWQGFVAPRIKERFASVTPLHRYTAAAL